jgi:hypothetical protein
MAESHMCVGTGCWVCGEPRELREMRHGIVSALIEHGELENSDAHALAYIASLSIKTAVLDMMTKIVTLENEIYLLKRGPLTSVEIDPNVRVRGNQTLSALENVHGPIAVGQAVEVFEPEADIVGNAWVSDIDTDKGLVYLRVMWSSLKERKEEK